MPQDKTAKTFEVSLKFKSSSVGNSDILFEILSSLKIPLQSIVQSERDGYSYQSVYLRNRLKAQALKRQLKNLHLKDVEVQYEAIRNVDWQNRWKKDFKPFKLTKQFDVVPIAYRRKHKANRRTPIYIDTSTAFGTGLHATTRFMAELIQQRQGRFEKFLDIGTGTGILSIIAKHCGASDIDALDIDRGAIKIAKENFLENNMSIRSARVANIKNLNNKRKYDFVAANLITQDLMDLKRKIVSFVKPGQFLAVSGISLNNQKNLQESFRSLPLRCLKILKGEGWMALLYKRI